MIKEKDLINDYIKPGIQNCINKVVEEEIEKMLNNLREKMKQEVGRIAVTLCRKFDIQKDLNKIIITFEDKSNKENKR